MSETKTENIKTSTKAKFVEIAGVALSILAGTAAAIIAIPAAIAVGALVILDVLSFILMPLIVATALIAVTISLL